MTEYSENSCSVPKIKHGDHDQRIRLPQKIWRLVVKIYCLFVYLFQNNTMVSYAIRRMNSLHPECSYKSWNLKFLCKIWLEVGWTNFSSHWPPVTIIYIYIYVEPNSWNYRFHKTSRNFTQFIESAKVCWFYEFRKIFRWFYEIGRWLPIL